MVNQNETSMEINTFNPYPLHNEEHFQYQKEFKELIEAEGAEKLDIKEKFGEYSTAYTQEEEALNQVRKSATTDEIEIADKDRDVLISGFTGIINSYLKHFNEEKRAAATRYKIVLDQYGDIARKPYDDETAAIDKMVQDSLGPFAADIDAMVVRDWMDEINNRNIAFKTLQKSRYSEEANKTRLRMKTVRVSVDAAYRDIVKRINALILINGAANHENFVRELNVRITKTNNILATRRGRSKKNGGQTENDTPKE